MIKNDLVVRELLWWLPEKGFNVGSKFWGRSLLFNSLFPTHKEKMRSALGLAIVLNYCLQGRFYPTRMDGLSNHTLEDKGVLEEKALMREVLGKKKNKKLRAVESKRAAARRTFAAELKKKGLGGLGFATGDGLEGKKAAGPKSIVEEKSY